MRTEFTAAQLADPQMAGSEKVIRKCVHCGFCTATCPTYLLLGDELDSPRGRIYLIKDMLEQQRVPSAETVRHVDRCLSCLSCMTTCPSGVNYMHLVDHARAYIEANYRRPFADRMLRAVLAFVLPHPARFRIALHLARLSAFVRPLLGGPLMLRRMRAMLDLAARPGSGPVPAIERGPVAATPRGRVVLMRGCAEPVLRPEIRAATVRLLERIGLEVVFADGDGCCGALEHHMGRERASHRSARRNIDAWLAADAVRPLDAIVVTASGCGTTIKDYGHMLRQGGAAEGAGRVSALARDICEVIRDFGLPPPRIPPGVEVAYHSACSLQHGQKLDDLPRRLLAEAGFAVRQPREGHICCGSAGVYNILQPDIARQLRDRKAANIDATGAAVVATGNIGCASQLDGHVAAPVVHTVELLDWATGGPVPPALRDLVITQEI